MCTTVLHGPGITADADASDPVVITILKPFCIQLINWVKLLSLARSKCSHVLHEVSCAHDEHCLEGEPWTMSTVSWVPHVAMSDHTTHNIHMRGRKRITCVYRCHMAIGQILCYVGMYHISLHGSAFGQWGPERWESSVDSVL